MKKLLGAILLVVVLGVVGLVMARNAILKSVASRLIQEQTGFGFELEGVNVGLFSTSFEIEGLKLINPPDFPDPEAFEIARIYVDYDLFSLFTDKLHFKKIEVDIPSATVVVNREGESNFERLEKAFSSPPSPPPSAEPSTGESDGEAAPPSSPSPVEHPSSGEPPVTPETKPTGPAPEPKPEKTFVIDELVMKLGRVSYIDYSNGGPEPREFHHDLRVDLVKKNVTDPSELVGVLSGQLLMGAVMNIDGISSAVATGLEEAMSEMDINSEDIQKAVDDGMQKVGQALEELASDPDSPLGNLLQGLAGSSGSDTEEGKPGEAKDALGSFLNDLGIKTPE